MRCMEAILLHIPDAQCMCNEEINKIIEWVAPEGQQPTQKTLNSWIAALPPISEV